VHLNGEDMRTLYQSQSHLLLLHISDVQPSSRSCDSLEMLYIAVVWMCALTFDSRVVQFNTIGCTQPTKYLHVLVQHLMRAPLLMTVQKVVTSLTVT
jgi:hypothetical protein